VDRLPPRSIIGPPGMASPIVAHIPHASTVIPSEVRARLLVSDEALARELVRMTDWHTDTLFAFTGRLGATRLVNGVSRLVVDPERFTDDAQEPMAAVGQGAVYTRTSDGSALRELLDGERDALLGIYFSPYHADLAGLVGERLATDGRCLLLDCHSFATQPLASEPDQTPGRPTSASGPTPSTRRRPSPTPSWADLLPRASRSRWTDPSRGPSCRCSRTSSTGAWPR
jgi:N-formylglutamate deformylase